MENIPSIFKIGFILLTLVTMLYFYWATGQKKWFLIGAIVWLTLQGLLAWSSFYARFEAIPPRFLIIFISVFLFAIIFGWTKFGASFRAGVDLEKLHYIHIVRIFVEAIFLYGLFKYGLMAEETTFEGRNFDILPGLTAPMIGWLYFKKKVISTKALLIWNIISVLILFFTISQVVLSAPLPFQQFAIKQPSIAIFYFPFVWLPALVAPLAVTAHLITIKALLERKKS